MACLANPAAPCDDRVGDHAVPALRHTGQLIAASCQRQMRCIYLPQATAASWLVHWLSQHHDQQSVHAGRQQAWTWHQQVPGPYTGLSCVRHELENVSRSAWVGPCVCRHQVTDAPWKHCWVEHDEILACPWKKEQLWLHHRHDPAREVHLWTNDGHEDAASWARHAQQTAVSWLAVQIWDCHDLDGGHSWRVQGWSSA